MYPAKWRAQGLAELFLHKCFERFLLRSNRCIHAGDNFVFMSDFLFAPPNNRLEFPFGLYMHLSLRNLFDNLVLSSNNFCPQLFIEHRLIANRNCLQLLAKSRTSGDNSVVFLHYIDFHIMKIPFFLWCDYIISHNF